MNITKEDLLKQYTKEINDIADECDWKYSFSGEEVCEIVHGILVKNKVKTSLTPYSLHAIYAKKIDSMSINREEWVKNYGIPEIIGIIYTIIEGNK